MPGIPWPGANPRADQISLSGEGGTLAFTHADTLGGSDLVNPEQPALSLYTVSVEGGEAVRLEGPHSGAPSYSPDGNFLAFVRQVEVDDPATPPYQLWIRPVDGGAPILVADSTALRYPPVWAPDGRLLAFVRENHMGRPGQDVQVVSIAQDGQPAGEPKVISLPQWASHISGWTRDNELAVFLYGEARKALYTVPVEGGRAVQITPNAQVFHPRWMPDGQTIAYRGGELAGHGARGRRRVLRDRNRL